ncbi:WW domain-binding protein 2-like isoform X1 [Centruroides vittatus]|uniref:WW domain-binding protein 2-like isoform X1 n=1 Tax=Centruroides vittatus TaxID=120091 RepID=UPI00350EA8AF
MALNVAHPPEGIFIYNGEYILLFCDGVELQFHGEALKQFKGPVKGKLYLTTHRMIFKNDKLQHNLQSFDFPFLSIKVKLEQPILGPNSIKGVVNAFPGGNWEGVANFELKFLKGGAIDFGRAMLEAAKIVSGRETSGYYYTPPTNSLYQVPPVVFLPPAGMGFGFFLPVVFFSPQSDESTIFKTDDPPPYPGLEGISKPTTQGQGAAQDGKQLDEQPPPSYYDATKKK